MGLIDKYPYTDFHEINLDYLLKKYFEIDDELKSQIAGLKLEVNEHNILLKDASNNVLASIVAPYSSEADIANKDVLNNLIVSYLKSVAIDDNIITFTTGDGTNKVIAIPTATGLVVDCYANEDTNDINASDFAIGSFSHFLTPDYESYEDLENAFMASYRAGYPTTLRFFDNQDRILFVSDLVPNTGAPANRAWPYMHTMATYQESDETVYQSRYFRISFSWSEITGTGITLQRVM